MSAGLKYCSKFYLCWWNIFSIKWNESNFRSFLIQKHFSFRFRKRDLYYFHAGLDVMTFVGFVAAIALQTVFYVVLVQDFESGTRDRIAANGNGFGLRFRSSVGVFGHAGILSLIRRIEIRTRHDSVTWACSLMTFSRNGPFVFFPKNFRRWFSYEFTFKLQRLSRYVIRFWGIDAD